MAVVTAAFHSFLLRHEEEEEEEKLLTLDRH